MLVWETARFGTDFASSSRTSCFFSNLFLSCSISSELLYSVYLSLRKREEKRISSGFEKTHKKCSGIDIARYFVHAFSKSSLLFYPRLIENYFCIILRSGPRGCQIKYYGKAPTCSPVLKSNRPLFRSTQRNVILVCDDFAFANRDEKYLLIFIDFNVKTRQHDMGLVQKRFLFESTVEVSTNLFGLTYLFYILEHYAIKNLT